jgi:peroxiredoxin
MKHLIFGLCLILLAACKNSSPEKLLVEGNFTGAAGKKIMLAELPFDLPERMVIDSATLDSSGRFSLSAIQQQEGMYQLFIENGPGILLINDNNHITVQADVNRLNEYQVDQSKASKSIKSLFERLSALEEKSYPLIRSADSIANKKVADSISAPFYAARDKANREITGFLNAYLGLEKNATAAWYGLGVASHYLSKADWAVQLKKAVALHPRHAGLTLMKVSLAAAEAQESIGKNLLNKPVPDMYLPDTSGSMVSIKQFKGKWVLIDFWASWCAPCRKENPNLVAAYRQYRSKNFTILGVSLDENKQAWMKAIYADSLRWTHISDLKNWESKAVDSFKFNALPFNILVDTSGVAVAINLYGQALTDSLESKLKKPVADKRKVSP